MVVDVPFTEWMLGMLNNDPEVQASTGMSVSYFRVRKYPRHVFAQIFTSSVLLLPLSPCSKFEICPRIHVALGESIMCASMILYSGV